MQKREPSYTGSGNVNWYNYYGEQYGIFFKKIKNRTNVWFRNHTPGHISKENSNSKQCIHSNSDGKDTKEKKMLIQDSKGIINNDSLLRIKKLKF